MHQWRISTCAIYVVPRRLWKLKDSKGGPLVRASCAITHVFRFTLVLLGGFEETKSLRDLQLWR